MVYVHFAHILCAQLRIKENPYILLGWLIFLVLKEHKSTYTTQHVLFLRQKMKKKKNASEESLERYGIHFFITYNIF